MHTWMTMIDTWANSLRAQAQSPETIRRRREQLTRLAREHADRDPLSLTLTDLTNWLGSHTWAPETMRQNRASIRSFYTWAHATGQTDTNPAAQLPAVKAPAPKKRAAPIETVTAALRTADARSHLMLILSASQGLRRAEVAAIHADDIIRTSAGWVLIVHGKGSKQREIPLPKILAAKMLKAANGGFVFPGQDNGHLSPRWVGTLVREALGRKATMHQLRHLCANELHATTGDLILVQEMLGHSSVATTQRYVSRPSTELRAALATQFDNLS